MAKPKDLNGKFWTSNKPKDLEVTGNVALFLDFVYKHANAYKKLNAKSTDSKIMRDRVNNIRQMTAGIKKSSAAMNEAIKNCKSPQHDKFKIEVLMTYLELLRKAERDRQAWIKAERAAGNTANIKEILEAQSLDDVIRI